MANQFRVVPLGGSRPKNLEHTGSYLSLTQCRIQFLPQVVGNSRLKPMEAMKDYADR